MLVAGKGTNQKFDPKGESMKGLSKMLVNLLMGILFLAGTGLVLADDDHHGDDHAGDHPVEHKVIHHMKKKRHHKPMHHADHPDDHAGDHKDDHHSGDNH